MEPPKPLRALVTLALRGWPTGANILAVPLVPAAEDAGGARLGSNATAARALRRLALAFAEAEPRDAAPWDFVGVRWDLSPDPENPDLLRGETFVPGGPDAVPRMVRCQALFEELEEGGAVAEGETPPHARPWAEITEGRLASLAARRDALSDAARRP